MRHFEKYLAAALSALWIPCVAAQDKPADYPLRPIRIITGIGRSLVGRFLRYDALNMTIRELKLRKDPACPVCSARLPLPTNSGLRVGCSSALPRTTALTSTGMPSR